MSSLSSELPLTKFETPKEKSSTPLWTLVQGNLNKLFDDENSNECIIFERNLPVIDSLSDEWILFVKKLPHFKTKYGDQPDHFAKTDPLKLKVTQIVLCRQERSIYDYSLDTLNDKYGPKHITLFFCLGDGIRRAFGCLSSDHTERFKYVFSPSKDLKSAGLNASEMLLFSFFRQYGLTAEDNIAGKNRLAKLFEYNRLYTETYLGFQIGAMHPDTFAMLINILHKLNMITTEDIPFLKSISKTRDLSTEEQILNSEMQKALAAGEVKIALEKAGMLHAFSRNLGKAMGTFCYETLAQGKALVIVPETTISYAQTEVIPPKILFTLLDDCPAAFKLAEHFEQRNMLNEAIAALNMITSYKQNITFFCHSKKKFLVKYYAHLGPTPPRSYYPDVGVLTPGDYYIAFQSPYLDLAEKISDKLTPRLNRMQIIKTSFLKLWKEDRDALDTLKTLTQQIETHAGYCESGTVDRLFDKIKLTAENLMSRRAVLSEIVNIMADKLLDFRKQKCSTNLTTMDIKRKMEESSTQREDSEGVAKSNITKAIMNLGHYDPPVAIEMIKTLMGLIENRVGERFLDNISLNPEPTPDICYELFYEVVITMANKLYCHRKLQSQFTTVLTGSDEKRNIEKSLTERQEKNGIGEEHAKIAKSQRAVALAFNATLATNTSNVTLSFSQLAASTTNTVNTQGSEVSMQNRYRFFSN